MGKSFGEVEAIKTELVDILFKSGYVNSVGISKLCGKKVSLKAGESLDDYCISVGFREQPPKDFKLFGEYKGVRVFYEVIGEIIPY